MLAIAKIAAQLIVGRALVGVAQNFVGFGDFAEANFRFVVARIAIRMMLHGQLTVRAFDRVLIRLARIWGEDDLERRAAGVLRLVRDTLPRAPSAFGWALCALDLYLSMPREIAVIGSPGSERGCRLWSW